LQLEPVAQGSKKRRLELGPLKTAKSQRTLVVPAVCLRTLRKHRKRQLEDRLKAGATWQDTGLVFTTYAPRGRQVGAGLHPRNVLRLLHALLAEAGLCRIRFHELRHAAASLLIASGVELVEISKLLSHCDIRITANLYGHLLKQTATKAASIMDAVLRPSRRPKANR